MLLVLSKICHVVDGQKTKYAGLVKIIIVLDWGLQSLAYIIHGLGIIVDKKCTM